MEKKIKERSESDITQNSGDILSTRLVTKPANFTGCSTLANC